MSLLTVILTVVCAFLALRLWAGNRLVGELLEAARKGRPVLAERRAGPLAGRRNAELVAAFNRLLKENAAISDTGQGYLDQIQTTLGNLREAVVMVDGSGTIRLSNPVFAELVSAEGDAVGQRLDLFVQGDAFHEFLRDVRGAGEGRREELEARIGSRSLWLDVSAAPLQRNAYPEGRYTLFVFHDITRQKKLEMMRTEFVANVSHELKTPVTVIKGFAETLVEDAEILSPQERARFLEKIRDNSERLHTLLQDLLLLSRLESTELVLHRESIPLHTFLKDLASNWETAFEKREQSMILELEEAADAVHADPLRLTQVITNLLENVQRHARGFTEVRLGAKRSGDSVVIHVSDNGAGIPEKDLPHVFERFYRVEKGRSRESGGTGLGLSIVKHIVAQHGGEIRAKSGKGEGTTIEIVLPYGK